MQWPYTPQQCLPLRADGPLAWQAAVRRAVEIADHDADFTQHVEPWLAVDLLAIMIYGTDVPADEVDLRMLIDRIDAADQEHIRMPPHEEPTDTDAWIADFHARERLAGELRAQQRARLEQLHADLAGTLRNAGHDLDAPPGTDPVVDVWNQMDIVPVNNGAVFSEYSTHEVHPQGSTALGRPLPTVAGWLRAAGPIGP